MTILTIKILVTGYLLVCIALYFFQEKLIFFPQKLPASHQFRFVQPFEELQVAAADGGMIHGMLFKSGKAAGLVFYLHGNAGSLDTWGDAAKLYTSLGYDFFIPDYPGYGKSEGRIRSQSQLFSAVQSAYNEIKKRYREDSIVIAGYSIGTGPASWLASNNHPRLLILQAPYYSLTDLMRKAYPVFPAFLLRYTFNTSEYLKQCPMPVVFVHGIRDQVIYYNSSVRLKSESKTGDTLITLAGQGHNGINENPEYASAIAPILHANLKAAPKQPD